MDKSKLSPKPDNSYADIISADGSGAPEFLNHAPHREIGTEPISVERYWSKEFYDLENKYLWPRTWQMACLSSDVANIGDCYLYEIGDLSLIHI